MIPAHVECLGAPEAARRMRELDPFTRERLIKEGQAAGVVADLRPRLFPASIWNNVNSGPDCA